MKVDTINVIEMWNGQMMQVISFEDNPEGRSDAEQLFTSMIQSNHDDLEAEDFDFYLDEGMFDDDNGWMIYLIHSN